MRERWTAALEKAFDLAWERLIYPNEAARNGAYLCPCCYRQVHLRAGKYKVAHFAHNQGEGSTLCDLYHPGTGDLSAYEQAVSESGAPLLLHLHKDGSGWSLFVELEALSLAESVRSYRSLLRFDGIQLKRDDSQPRRLSAELLWPGTGGTTVVMEPARHSTSVTPIGQWPSSIDMRRWKSLVPGLSSSGVLFVPYRGGSFRMYDDATPLHWGDTIVVLGPLQCGPPDALEATALKVVVAAHFPWHAWKVRLPHSATAAAVQWLKKFRASASRPQERTQIVSMPVEYGTGGIPRYFVGDPIVVAPSRQANILAAELHSTLSVTRLDPNPAGSRVAAFTITAAEAGTMRVRTNLGKDVARVEIITTASISSDPMPTAWLVRHSGNVLRPFSSHRFPERDEALRVESDLVSCAFAVTASFPGTCTETLRRADAQAATTWMRSRLDSATSFQVDAGNLGFVRLDYAGVAVAAERPSDKRHASKIRRTWAEAFDHAADGAGDPGTPHWRINGRRAARANNH
ncbi:hypothetical protein [Gordonia sp. NB41Y]|uniref:competence protein CoiA family protein n=1 Tax=Gordonia sp. NB41Y TaxID=875808 RepID=UPI00128F1A2B|nr:hypothetical protein [Gordonia sp. NB41Y]WLP92870.1 hypothetical protein Q9K23_11925 [Gordonia sp. NB41Y]